MKLRGVAHAPGSASGPALVLEEPLSFWGGVDPASGEIIDRHHPQWGRSITGTILVIPHGRGSSGGSAVLTESIRVGTAPAGIVMGQLDTILHVGALVARELYPGRSCPMVVVGADLTRLEDGASTTIDRGGEVRQG